MILDEILERVYLMRCQLVHGAATWRQAESHIAEAMRSDDAAAVADPVGGSR